MSDFKYTGNELEIFKFAKNWKNYYYDKIINSFNSGSVLEVGAGIGEITRLFEKVWRISPWLCLEPDQNNIKKIKKKNLVKMLRYLMVF